MSEIEKTREEHNKKHKDVMDNLRLSRNIAMSEETWQRFQKGECNLIEELFDEVKKLIQKTNNITIEQVKNSSWNEGFNLGVQLAQKDEIGFLNYLIEYPELCREKCKERLKQLKENPKDSLVLDSHESSDKDGGQQ